MVKRDPHAVLGVEHGADAAAIKAAWRRLARSNHPDLTGDDPAASGAATRRMAEINDAYAALTREPERERPPLADRTEFGADEQRRPGGPPRPRPSRPVTGRVDTTASFRPRDERSASSGSTGTRTSGASGASGTGASAKAGTEWAGPLSGQAPPASQPFPSEPPRASTPTGPMERDQLRHFRRPAPPSLEMAREHPVEFGKFHGHTLGEIAAFEPSYIDWVASTVTRDPELVAAARVIQADFDARGVRRRAHPTPARPSRSA